MLALPSSSSLYEYVATHATNTAGKQTIVLFLLDFTKLLRKFNHLK